MMEQIPRPIKPLQQTLDEAVLYALSMNFGNISQTAQQLKIGRATMYRYINRLRDAGLKPFAVRNENGDQESRV